jgi:hypothetical protein
MPASINFYVKAAILAQHQYEVFRKTSPKPYWGQE